MKTIGQDRDLESRKQCVLQLLVLYCIRAAEPEFPIDNVADIKRHCVVKHAEREAAAMKVVSRLGGMLYDPVNCNSIFKFNLVTPWWMQLNCMSDGLYEHGLGCRLWELQSYYKPYDSDAPSCTQKNIPTASCSVHTSKPPPRRDHHA
jgi:hypothetical protein